MNALYRHFDSSGALLYVGISLSAVARLGGHKRSPWFKKISTVTIQHFRTRVQALRAERRAIAREKPLHNVMGKGSGKLSDIDGAKFLANWPGSKLVCKPSKQGKELSRRMQACGIPASLLAKYARMSVTSLRRFINGCEISSSWIYNIQSGLSRIFKAVYAKHFKKVSKLNSFAFENREAMS